MNNSIIARVDRTTHVDVSRLVPAPAFPKSLKIEITSRCNFQCTYCAHKKGMRRTGDMDWDLFLKIISDAVSAGVKEVGLFLLGEPFMNKDLPRMIAHAKRSGIEYVFVTTNGSLCTEENLADCIYAGLDSLKFSINAPRSGYADTHGVSVDVYDRVLETIKWLSEWKVANNSLRPTTCVSSIFVPDHAEDLAKLEAAVKPYVDEFYYLPMYSQAGTVKADSQLVGNTGRLHNGVPAVPCWGLFNSARVTWDGWLTACCFDHSGHFKIADVSKMSLCDAWKSSRFVALRTEHLDYVIEDDVCQACLRRQ